MDIKINLISVLLAVSVSGQAIVGKANEEPDCEGSIELIAADGKVMEVTEDQEDISMKAVTAVSRGCGCYRLYEKTERRGRSYLMDNIGEHSIPLRMVGSLTTVPCSRGAMAAWRFSLIVVGVVSATGLMIAVMYKRMGDRHQPAGRAELCQHQLL